MAQRMYVSGSGSGKMLGWNIPPEDQDLIHPHWRQYEAIPSSTHMLLAFIYFILFVVSVSGNGLVLFVFGTSKPLRTASNYFLMNLAVFDLLMATEMPFFIGNSFYERLRGHSLACNLYATAGSLSGIGGAITNAFIAYDRYRCVSSPMNRLTKNACLGLVLVTWLWAVPPTALPALQLWSRFIPEGFLTTCSFDYLTLDRPTKWFNIVLFTWAYTLPMILIVISYFRLYGHVVAHQKMLAEQAKKMNVASLQANKDSSSESIEIRIAKAAFVVFFLFLCSWTPYAVVTLIGGFGNQALLTPMTTMIPAITAKVVSCLDPWVYAVSHPRYRMELEKRFPWMGITEKPESKASDTKSEVTNVETAT